MFVYFCTPVLLYSYANCPQTPRGGQSPKSFRGGGKGAIQTKPNCPETPRGGQLLKGFRRGGGGKGIQTKPNCPQTPRGGQSPKSFRGKGKGASEEKEKETSKQNLTVQKRHAADSYLKA